MWVVDEAEARDCREWAAQAQRWFRDEKGSGRIMGYPLGGSSINTGPLISSNLSGEWTYSTVPFKGADDVQSTKSLNWFNHCLFISKLLKSIAKYCNFRTKRLLALFSVTHCMHTNTVHTDQNLFHSLISFGRCWHGRDSLPFGRYDVSGHTCGLCQSLLHTQAVADGLWEVSASSFVVARYWTILPGPLSGYWERLGSTSKGLWMFNRSTVK